MNEYTQARRLERKRERAENKTPNLFAPLRANLDSRREFVRFMARHQDEIGEDAVITICLRNLGPMTHREIGIVLGVSTQRIEQIEMRALVKARKELERRGLTFEALV